MSDVAWKPDGNPIQIPYMFFDDCEAAIALYGAAFDAREVFRMPGPDGKVMHGELEMLGSKIMMSTANKDHNCLSPSMVGGSPMFMCLYVPDVDAACAKAEAAGMKVLRPLETQFWGDRACMLLDPFGYSWHLATHVEDVSPEEIERRRVEIMGG